jgi:hypothetical protein
MSFNTKHTSDTLTNWGSIDWDMVELKVKQMQSRIVKAEKLNLFNIYL